MKELWHVLAGRRVPFLTILVLESLSGGIEAIVHPLLVKALFDQSILAKNFERFLVLSLFYLLVGLILNSSSYSVSLWRKRYENSTVLAIETELLRSTIAQDGRAVSRAGNASFVSRIHNDVYEGVLPSIDTSLQVARQAVSSLAFVGVLVYLSWQASLILVVIVPPLYAFSKHLARKVESNTDAEREAEAQYINRLTRTLEAFQALRGLRSLYPKSERVSAGALTKFLDITYANFRISTKQRTVSDLVMNLSDTASMVVGAYFVFAGRMTFGGFLAFVNAFWRALTGIFFVVNTLPQVRRNSAVLTRIETLRGSCPPTYYDSADLVLLSNARIQHETGPEIRFDHFELHAGEHVILRAPNGTGKTTLLHVIAGTLSPDTGTVSRPDRVATLTAPVQLPPLTVSEIVPDLALRGQLGLMSLSDQLPADLSSGQRQRLGVAALLSEQADLYLVDEPLANLDQAAKELVLDVLLERTASRGLLVVHHGDEEIDARFDRVAGLAAASDSWEKVAVPQR